MIFLLGKMIFYWAKLGTIQWYFLLVTFNFFNGQKLIIDLTKYLFEKKKTFESAV